jgi:hypothetical protein
MKRPLPLDDGTRFNGQLRHYHRSGVRVRRSWDEWVDGDGAKSGVTMKWLKITFISLGILTLGGIIAGLVITLQ